MTTEPEELQPQPEPMPEKKKATPMQIVLYNLLAVFAYTLLFRLLGQEGIFLELFAVPIHAVVCLIAAPITRKVGMANQRVCCCRNWFCHLCRSMEH
jgi:hypothetical protein